MVGGYENIKRTIKNRVRRLKEGCGGKCIICGYNKSFRALAFHHINEHLKEFTIAQNYLYRWDEIIKEVKKCLLVCSNCHMEIHDNLYNEDVLQKYHLSMIYNIPTSEELKQRRIKTRKLNCPICKREFNQTKINQKYCSPKCWSITFRKVKSRPSIEILLKQVKESNFVQVAKLYGVSDNTIRKWIKGSVAQTVGANV